jgi:hypothetical protein
MQFRLLRLLHFSLLRWRQEIEQVSIGDFTVPTIILLAHIARFAVDFGFFIVFIIHRATYLVTSVIYLI